VRYRRLDNNSVQVIIRPFHSTDLDRIVDIEQRSFPDPWSNIEFKLVCKRNPRGFLIAVKNEIIVGYIIADVIMDLDGHSIQVKKRGHILNIAVHPEFRREHIGKALIEAITTYLRNKEVEELCLEVRSSNIIARSFYLSMGFNEKRRKLGYYFTEDAVMMMKKL
jgi:ribosomal-protein-alanine N-acetyltransferase